MADKDEQAKYSNIIFDFKWLTLQETLDENIHNNDALLELDQVNPVTAHQSPLSLFTG